jgi:hypothetical protein
MAGHLQEDGLERFYNADSFGGRQQSTDSVEKPAAEIEASASLGTAWRARSRLCGRWGGGYRDQLSHLAEVLSGGGEEELVSCAVWTSQAQAVEF